MKNHTTLAVAVKVIFYSLLVVGLAEIVRLDAKYPMEEGYFGEISFTEISQEIILFILFGFYLLLGYRYRPVQPVTNIVSLFFLISFIREFNFLIDWWFYPSLLVLFIIIWLVVRDYKKMGKPTQTFFAQPASAWFFAGFLVTYIFSRLMGRSGFWLLMYDADNYRLAKAAAEEGIELLGNGLMLISAIEFALVFWNLRKREAV